MLAWLNVLVSPVVYLYNMFMAYKYNIDYTVAHTPQVCFIQAVLNDSFDTALRRISIIDGPDKEPLYVFETLESKPAPLYGTSESKPIALLTDNEILNLGPDFVVQVPTIVTTIPGWNLNYLNALISQFALAGKTHVIAYT